MILEGATVNENIIKEDDDEMAEVLSEDAVHSRLERGWCIAKTKRYYLELVMAVVSSESHFRNIGAMHSYLMVTL